MTLRPLLPSLFLALSTLGLVTGCRSGRGGQDWEQSEAQQAQEAQEAQEEELEVGSNTFTVRAQEVDRDAFEQVVGAVRRAGRELKRWGDFRDPVEVLVLPDRERFDEAVGEGRFPDRRGFARYDQIFLLSPSAWGRRGAREAELDELVLHELTHALMYQHASTRTGWRRKGIPFWFREGMASYTARQAYRWKEPSREQLREGRSVFQEEREDENQLGERDGGRTRYGLAHYAFDALLARGGERRIRELLEEMDDGAGFDEAFEETYRKPLPDFIAELERTLPETQ